MSITTIQKVLPRPSGVRLEMSDAGLVTKTVPVRRSRRIEKTRMTYSAPLPM